MQIISRFLVIRSANILAFGYYFLVPPCTPFITQEIFDRILRKSRQADPKLVLELGQGQRGQHHLLRTSPAMQNILNPSNKIQCDDCKRDISKATKVMIEETDYCCSCFANQNQFPSLYRVINKLDFPLFEADWSADQELLLFEGLEKLLSLYSGMALATGEKSPILSELTKLGKMSKTTISTPTSPKRISFP